jgi:hypothetical protein
MAEKWQRCGFLALAPNAYNIPRDRKDFDMADPAEGVGNEISITIVSRW